MTTESAAQRERPWQHLLRVAHEEVSPMLSGRFFAQLATAFPSQSFSRTRTKLLRQAGVQIGARSLVQGPLHITGEGNPCREISIGEYTMISGTLHLDIGAPIRIGSRVRIGHDVSLITVDHDVGPEEMRSGKRKFGPIEIGDGAWLASRVVVLPGVRVGAGAIVAAGSLVTRDVPANALVVGVPARVVRDLNQEPRAEDGHGEAEGAPLSSRRFLRPA